MSSRLVYKAILTSFLFSLFLICFSFNADAQTTPGNIKVYQRLPVKLDLLKKSLTQKKKYSENEVIDVIETCGVDFALSDEDEKSLKAAGVTDSIIKAIKENLRPDANIVGKVGVLNGKALSLGTPAYPPAARAVGATGAVNVLVVIDTAGSVVSAQAISGHPLLRAASEQAAGTSKFAPFSLNGKPVSVSGIIVYNFVR